MFGLTFWRLAISPSVYYTSYNHKFKVTHRIYFEFKEFGRRRFGRQVLEQQWHRRTHAHQPLLRNGTLLPSGFDFSVAVDGPVPGDRMVSRQVL
jgi:hypothetical protein